MTAITSHQSPSITNSSRQSPTESSKKIPTIGLSGGFLIAGSVAGLNAGINLSNVVAHEILGLCNPWIISPTESYYPCANNWQKFNLGGSTSLALLTTSLAISYGPVVIEKIKSLPLFGKIKNSSELEPKGKDIDLVGLITRLAVMIPIMSAGVAGGQLTGSLFTFSRLAVNQLSGTCIQEIVLNSNENSTYNYCNKLIADGKTELLAASLALTALVVSVASLALIGRVRKWANNTPTS